MKSKLIQKERCGKHQKARKRESKGEREVENVCVEAYIYILREKKMELIDVLARLSYGP